MRLRFGNALGCGVLLVVSFCARGLVMAQTAAKPSAENLALIKDAAQAIAAGELKRAESELSDVLAAAPDDFRALDLMGVIRAQQQREAEAEKLFERAIEIKPDFASAHVSLGMLYVQMAKPDDAVPQFEEALRLDPERSDARASLVSVWRGEARAAAGENDLEKALSLLLKARKESAKDADVLYDFGMVALRMSLFADAAQAFQEALVVQNDVRKDDGKALYGLGRAQMSMANFEGARATFDRYCQVRPADASGHFAYGMTLEALQRVGEARGEFEKSIALQPA
ncbi:MAG: tetratricopeptide repeat protein, partial [Terriglobales bacterium]